MSESTPLGDQPNKDKQVPQPQIIDPQALAGLLGATLILKRCIEESRASATVSTYQQKIKELAKFWWIRCPNTNQDQVRLLFLAEKFKIGGVKTLPIHVAAHNFYLGHLSSEMGHIQKALLEAASKSAIPTQHRRKMSLEDFDTIMETSSRSGDYDVRRSGIIALLAFRAALRISEVLNLTCQDLEFASERAWIVSIKKSKTDQAAQGVKIPFRVTTAEDNRLFSFLKMITDRNQFLFKSYTTERPITYSTAVSELKKLFAEAGLTERRYTSHSFRGGAASAALEAGWDSSSVMATGRWKSVEAFQAYIRPQPLPIAQQSHDQLKL